VRAPYDEHRALGHRTEQTFARRTAVRGLGRSGPQNPKWEMVGRLRVPQGEELPDMCSIDMPLQHVSMLV